MLIRKPSRDCSPDSSRSWFLEDRHEPQVPSVPVTELDRYVAGELVDSTYCSDWDKIAQDRNVLQSSSIVLAAVHVRFIAIVGYRQEEVRRFRRDVGRQRARLDMQANLIVAFEMNRRKA
jgi:hypothetical protein